MFWLLSGAEKPSSNLQRVQSVCRADKMNLQPSFEIKNVGDSPDLEGGAYSPVCPVRGGARQMSGVKIYT